MSWTYSGSGISSHPIHIIFEGVRTFDQAFWFFTECQIDYTPFVFFLFSEIGLLDPLRDIGFERF